MRLPSPRKANRSEGILKRVITQTILQILAEKTLFKVLEVQDLAGAPSMLDSRGDFDPNYIQGRQSSVSL